MIYCFLWKCRFIFNNLSLYRQNFLFSSDSSSENRFARCPGFPRGNCREINNTGLFSHGFSFPVRDDGDSLRKKVPHLCWCPLPTCLTGPWEGAALRLGSGMGRIRRPQKSQATPSRIKHSISFQKVAEKENVLNLLVQKVIFKPFPQTQ